MTVSIRVTHAALCAALLSGAFLCLPQGALAARPAGAQAAQDSPAANSAAARLTKSQFKDVKVSVDNGIATLTGSVALYEYKADAAKRVVRASGVTAVRNMIEVAGPNLSDQELQAKLQDRLNYDRVGYGNVFNAISVTVENGVVTLAGHARTDPDKDSAMGLVATTPGVKEVVGEIEVDPVSIFDDRTRIEVARAIYSFPSLTRYSMDPAMPIRISVQNGNVELYGTVSTTGDKEAAALRANGVSGVFSVKNYLLVANQPSEAPKHP